MNFEASKGGIKVGRVKDPLDKDSYLGIIPPTFTPPLEPFDERHAGAGNAGQREVAKRSVDMPTGTTQTLSQKSQACSSSQRRNINLTVSIRGNDAKRCIKT